MTEMGRPKHLQWPPAWAWGAILAYIVICMIAADFMGAR